MPRTLQEAKRALGVVLGEVAPDGSATDWAPADLVVLDQVASPTRAQRPLHSSRVNAERCCGLGGSPLLPPTAASRRRRRPFAAPRVRRARPAAWHPDRNPAARRAPLPRLRDHPLDGRGGVGPVLLCPWRRPRAVQERSGTGGVRAAGAASRHVADGGAVDEESRQIAGRERRRRARARAPAHTHTHTHPHPRTHAPTERRPRPSCVAAGRWRTSSRPRGSPSGVFGGDDALRCATTSIALPRPMSLPPVSRPSLVPPEAPAPQMMLSS